MFNPNQYQYQVDTRQNSALSWAAGSGHLKVTEWLVRDVCANVDHMNKEGRSAVMWAGADPSYIHFTAVMLFMNLF